MLLYLTALSLPKPGTFSRKSAKDLMLEGLTDYIIPKYTKMPE